jgi:hypothetical protein
MFDILFYMLSARTPVSPTLRTGKLKNLLPVRASFSFPEKRIIQIERMDIIVLENFTG